MTDQPTIQPVEQPTNQQTEMRVHREVTLPLLSVGNKTNIKALRCGTKLEVCGRYVYRGY